jgi:hypothetical protein
MIIMEVAINRPRPFQTKQFHAANDTEDKCKVEFQPAYRRYDGPNPCKYKLHSCPSGHTATTTAICVMMVCIATFSYRLTKFHAARKHHCH